MMKNVAFGVVGKLLIDHPPSSTRSIYSIGQKLDITDEPLGLSQMGSTNMGDGSRSGTPDIEGNVTTPSAEARPEATEASANTASTSGAMLGDGDGDSGRGESARVDCTSSISTSPCAHEPQFTSNGNDADDAGEAAKQEVTSWEGGAVQKQDWRHEGHGVELAEAEAKSGVESRPPMAAIAMAMANSLSDTTSGVGTSPVPALPTAAGSGSAHPHAHTGVNVGIDDDPRFSSSTNDTAKPSITPSLVSPGNVGGGGEAGAGTPPAVAVADSSQKRAASEKLRRFPTPHDMGGAGEASGASTGAADTEHEEKDDGGGSTKEDGGPGVNGSTGMHSSEDGEQR